nr:hypothetical protein [Tanacetum cinerariifolium]
MWLSKKNRKSALKAKTLRKIVGKRTTRREGGGGSSRPFKLNAHKQASLAVKVSFDHILVRVYEYKCIGSSSPLKRILLSQANMLLRYEALNDDYADLYYIHESCKDVAQHFAETKQYLEKHRSDEIYDLDKEKKSWLKVRGK